MSDERGEAIPTTEVPDSRLTERLLSRGEDSLGLIDVRAAERHYARIMDWLAARSPLLERLKTRYGVAEGEGLTGLAFAEPSGRAGDEAVNLSAAPGVFNAPVTERLFTHVAHVRDEPPAAQTEAKRIARRGVPTFSPASPVQGPDAGATRGREEVVRQQPGEGIEPSPEPAAPKQEHTRPTLPSVEERAPTTAAQEQTLARGGAPAAGAAESPPTSPTGTDAAAAVVKDPTHAKEPSAAAKPGAVRVAEAQAPDALTPAPRARASEHAQLSEHTQLSEHAPAAGHARAVARERVSATTAPAVDEAEGMTFNRRGAAEAPEVAAEVTRVAAEGVKAAAPKAAGVKLPVAGETHPASPAFETPRPLAHAREIRVGEPGGAAAGLHAQTPLPLAQSPHAAESVEPARRPNDAAPAVARPSPGGAETFTPGRARASARGEEVNIPRLAEEVSRHLARRLTVERERRGWGRR